MIHFSKLKEWQFNPESGEIEFRLNTPDGKVYEASFSREMVPEMLIRMHQLLSATSDQFPRGLKELVEAYIPKSLSVVVLPNGDPALEIVTLTDMRVPIHLTREVSTAIRGALVDADPILSAQSQARHH